MSGIFVTGTDTGCGKTTVSLALMAAFQASGLRVLGMKPVASGCVSGPAGLRNADALRLQRQGSAPAPYAQINPYAFAPPIAPHLAAGQCGIAISPTVIATAYRALHAQADLVVAEGIGGWRVPLGSGFCLSDLPRMLDLPVILTVGLRLGCINHALLTAESIQAHNVPLAGWIASQIDPDMPLRAANLTTLAALIEAPCLGVIPWLADADSQVPPGVLNIASLIPDRA